MSKAASNKAQDAFKWWDELSRIRPEDSLGTKIRRVLIRISGIVFLVVFSPILLLALSIAFLVML